MADGKDLAKKQYFFIGLALLGGVAAGAWLLAPVLKKSKDKKAANKKDDKKSAATPVKKA